VGSAISSINTSEGFQKHKQIMKTANKSYTLLALLIIGSLALASEARQLAASASATAFSDGNNVYTSSSSSSGGYSSARASSGDKSSISSSLNGQGSALVSDGTTTLSDRTSRSRSARPVQVILSSAKDSDDDEQSRIVAVAGNARPSTGKKPVCSGDYSSCCNWLHRSSDVCKCNITPLNGLFKSLWRCDAVRVEKRSGSTVWQDQTSGYECRCA